MSQNIASGKNSIYNDNYIIFYQTVTLLTSVLFYSHNAKVTKNTITIMFGLCFAENCKRKLRLIKHYLNEQAKPFCYLKDFSSGVWCDSLPIQRILYVRNSEISCAWKERTTKSAFRDHSLTMRHF